MGSLKLSAASWRWITGLAFLGGAFLRWTSLCQGSTLLHYDEAWNAVDALGLLHQPHLTPFLPTTSAVKAAGLIG